MGRTEDFFIKLALKVNYYSDRAFFSSYLSSSDSLASGSSDFSIAFRNIYLACLNSLSTVSIPCFDDEIYCYAKRGFLCHQQARARLL